MLRRQYPMVQLSKPVAMLFASVLCLGSATAPVSDPGSGVWLRFRELDELAGMIRSAGDVPEGGDMLLFSAASGWPALTTSVLVLPANTDIAEVLETLRHAGADTVAYGLSPGRHDRANVLVSAPVPAILPELEDPFGDLGETRELRFSGIEDHLSCRVIITTPSMTIEALEPDSSGAFRLELAQRGIYWVEVVRDSLETGPRVELLFPVVAGFAREDLISGSLSSASSGATTLQDILEETNLLRDRMGLPPLEREQGLDSLARRRAGRVAIDGSLHHISSEGPSIQELLEASQGRLSFGENLGRGGSLAEAMSMILVSPSHLESCLSPCFTSIGLGASVDSNRSGWQIVLVQVFAGPAEEVSDR